MANSVKEKISTDLKQAKDVGQLRADRIREIVRSAIAQVLSEFKEGSGEIRSLVKDAFSGAVSSIQESGTHAKEEITASVEGVIEGISRARQQRISETEAEVKRLQAQLEAQEEELEQDVEAGLVGLQEAGRDMSTEVREQVDRAIDAIRNSEEVALLKKRHAQLQAQMAILRANLAARGGDSYDRAQAHLDDAKRWYGQARPKAEELKGQADQKLTDLDHKIGEAGTALARREQHVRQVLRDLLRQATDLLKEGDHEPKRSTEKLPPCEVTITDKEVEEDANLPELELPPTREEMERSKLH